MICMCTLAGTAACKTCRNNPDSIFVTGTTTVTDTPQITYVPERTCKVIEMHEHVTMDEPDIAELSCGHDIMVFDMEPPNYCPVCGAKVVVE